MQMHKAVKPPGMHRTRNNANSTLKNLQTKQAATREKQVTKYPSVKNTNQVLKELKTEQNSWKLTSNREI
jgi:hypothetical protein